MIDMKNLLLLKIQEKIKLGHVNRRGKTRYNFSTPLINCIGHAGFGFDNNFLLENFNPSISQDIFGDFESWDEEGLEKEILSLIKSSGLEITPCIPSEILKKNQWKVALYFGYHPQVGCSLPHMIKQEEPELWSEKMGFDRDVSFYGELLKTIYPCYQRYDFYNTYKITNPYAEENN